ncbi:MAG: cyclic nucleotide-binding domain-containing protein [Byssovorax sp.]
MSDTLPLRKQDFAMLFTFCPDLRRVAKEEQERLADLFTLEEYPAGRTLAGPALGPTRKEHAAPKLRVIVSGHVQLEQHLGEARGRRACGPMDLVGEETVIAWDDERRSGAPPGASSAPSASPSLHTTEPTWILELPRDRFPEAFPEGSTALQAIRTAHQVNALASRAIDLLERTEQLGNVRSSDLYHLLEGGDITAPGEVLVARGEIPQDFFLIFEGRFSFTRPGARQPSLLEGPAVAGLDGLISGTPSDSDIRAEGTSTVLRLSGETFWQIFTIDADFQRAIVRTNPAASRMLADRAGGMDAGLLVLFPSARLVDDRGDVARALGGLSDLLGERMACHLYDRVLVLHLLPAGSPPRAPEAQDFTEGFEGEAIADCPWIERRWVPVDRGIAATIKAEVSVPAPPRDRGGARSRAEVVLVDPSALPREDVIEGVIALDLARKVVLLSPVPGELPPLQFLVRGVPILHAGVLCAEALHPGLGHVFSHARATHGSATQRLADKVRAATVAIGDLAADAAGTAAMAGRAFVRNATAGMTGAVEPAWPIGAVRLRFSTKLLSLLADARGGPARWPEVLSAHADLDDRQREALVETFDRWARSATCRRVGLTLSGGGPYGVIHIPLLQRILDRKLPIDLVSGTSVGSSVGAYYAVLGREGLDLFIEHALRMNLACVASIVSSAAFQAVIALDLGPVPLIETELPFFPVVTDADVGIEWDVRHGNYALGVRASGSLPPLGPTVIGNRRFLDGGLVANVPVNVLRDEGAALIIASNAIASVSPGGRSKAARFGLFQPIVEALEEASLRGRFDDIRRMIPLIFRTVGDAQANAADVTYRPSYRDVSFWSSFSQADLKRGEISPDLEQRVTELENRWRSLLRHPPSRVRIDASNRLLSLLSPICFTDGNAVDASSLPILTEAAQFLCTRAEGLRITLLGIEVAAKTQVAADARAAAVAAQLAGGGVDRARLRPYGVVMSAGAPQGVVLRIEKQEMSAEEARRKLDELRTRAEAAERSALAKALTMGAEWNCRRGDLDLGRLLAIEAASLERSPETDAVLRHALGRRGWTVRRLAGVKAVQQMALSPDGRLLAVGHGDGIVRLWDVAPETERSPADAPLAQVSHVGMSDPGITGVAWSSDGQLLATAGFDGRVLCHRVAPGGALTRVFEGAAGTWSQWGLAFSPRGRDLLGTSGGSRAKVALWRAGNDGVPCDPPVIVDCGRDVRRAVFSPDGAQIAAGTEGGVVFTWRAADPAPAPEERASEPEAIEDLAFAPQGEGLLAIASGDRARLLTPGGPDVVLAGHTRRVRRVSFRADGQALVTASDDGSARLWSIDGRFLMNLRGEDGPLTGAVFRPDGRVVATFADHGNAIVWDVASGEPVARLLGHEGAITAGAFGPDGSRLATGSIDAMVRVWAPDASAQVTFPGRLGVHHPSDPGLAITASRDGSAGAWDPRTGEAIASIQAASGGRAALAFDARGERVAIVSEGTREIRVLRTGSFGDPIHVLASASDDLTRATLAFDAGGRLLAVRGRKSVEVWDLSESPPSRRALDCSHPSNPRPDVAAIAWDPVRPGRLAVARWVGSSPVAIFDLARGTSPSATLRGPTDGAWAVAFSADGALLAAGCNDSKAYVHDAVSGDLLGSIPHANAVKCLAFAPRDPLLGTGDGGRVAAVFAIEREPFAARATSARSDHLDAVEVVAFSPDGAVFASGSNAGRVFVWRRPPGGVFTVSATLGGHDGGVRSLSFSPDSQRILTTGEDGTAAVHLVDPDALLRRVGEMPGPGAMSVDEWLRFFGITTPYRPTWPRPDAARPGKRAQGT